MSDSWECSRCLKINALSVLQCHCEPEPMPQGIRWMEGVSTGVIEPIKTYPCAAGVAPGCLVCGMPVHSGTVHDCRGSLRTV
jgi:hypothetical protein